MVDGSMYPTTVRCGRRPLHRDGRRIVKAAGSGNPTTVGPGFPMSLGAGRLITTDVGLFTTRLGSGGRDRSTPLLTTAQCGRRPTYPSSASAEVWESPSDSGSAPWAGFLLDLATRSTRGTGVAIATSSIRST